MFGAAVLSFLSIGSAGRRAGLGSTGQSSTSEISFFSSLRAGFGSAFTSLTTGASTTGASSDALTTGALTTGVSAAGASSDALTTGVSVTCALTTGASYILLGAS